MRLIGVDFTSAPSARKPIVAAIGRLDPDATVVVDRIERFERFDRFESLLVSRGPWVGAFDFPFGLSRSLVEALRWPSEWPTLIRHYASLDRRAISDAFDRFRAERPVGDKYARRATELAAGAHASMKLVNPPVAWMLHEGVPRLLAAGLRIPALQEVDCDRVALEAYPGFVFRSVEGAPIRSYKSDDARMHTAERAQARVRLLAALAAGAYRLRVRVDAPRAIRDAALADGTGDTLDSLACIAQAGWGALRASNRYGLPEGVDALEGWIAGA